MKRMVCSLRSNLALMASARARDSAVAPRWRATSIRMSTSVNEGRLRSSTRWVRRRSEYRPARALAWLSREGVAEPRRQRAAQSLARITATSRPWYRGLSSCLYAGSCSSSTTISFRSRTGAKTAERAPTATRTSPEASASHPSSRSPSLKWLCQTTVRWPGAIASSRDRSRATVCGVNATSGTSRITPPPDSRADWMARRYTSVFPDPVTPCRSVTPNFPVSMEAVTASTASCCSRFKSVGTRGDKLPLGKVVGV